MAPHYIISFLTDLGAEDLISRLLVKYATSEVIQYKFFMKELKVRPKHVTLPNIENGSKGIAGLESNKKPFKVNISPILNIREVVSVASL